LKEPFAKTAVSLYVVGIDNSPSVPIRPVPRWRERRAVEIRQRDQLVVVAVFIGIERTDQPFEGLARLRLQAEFLRELGQVERVVEPRLARPEPDQLREFAVGEGQVAAREGVRVGVARRRDEVGEAGVPVHGECVVLEVLLELLVHRDVVAQAVDAGVRAGLQRDRRIVVAVDVLLHGREVHVHRVALPQQRHARAGLVAVVDVFAAVEQVVHVTGDVVAGIAGAQREAVLLQRDVHADAVGIAPAVGAVGARDAAADAVFGRRRVGLLHRVLDQAAHRAGAVQRALRAAQHFDAFHVVGQQVERVQRGLLVQAVGTDRRFVDVGAHRRSGRERRDAAHRDLRLARRALRLDRQARHVVRVVGHLRGVDVLQLLVADLGDRHGHFADVFLALVGGDGDRVQLLGLLGLRIGGSRIRVAGRRGLLRQGRAGHAEGQGESDRGGQRTALGGQSLFALVVLVHSPLPKGMSSWPRSLA
jgi:hypothetical protein